MSVSKGLVFCRVVGVESVDSRVRPPFSSATVDVPSVEYFGVAAVTES